MNKILNTGIEVDIDTLSFSHQAACASLSSILFILPHRRNLFIFIVNSI